MDTKRAAETALLAFIILVAAAACFLRVKMSSILHCVSRIDGTLTTR